MIERKLDAKISVALCEIDFTKLVGLKTIDYKLEKVSKYPKSEFDFNFVIPKNVLYSEIEKIAKSINTNLLYNVSLLDIYEPENSDTKSYTLHYQVWLNDRTMTGEDLETFHKEVVKVFKDNGYMLKD